MRIPVLLTLSLFFAAPAAAQDYFVGDDIFRYYARPFRDRAERFQSARADALQMRLAVDDESSRLTLENWGDNRADLRSGENRVRAGLSPSGGESYSSGSKWEYNSNAGGLYARFGRFELDAQLVRQKGDKTGTNTSSEYNKASAGAAFAFGPESLSLGVHANMNRSGDEDWEEVTENSAVGAALAVKTDLYELGATLDLVGRGTKDEDANYDVPRNGPQLGAQAMLKPFKGFKAALRASMARLDGSNARNGGTRYEDYKADHNELGARLEWRLEAVPLTLGAEYSKLFYDPNYTAAGVFKKSENDYSLKSAGAALRLLGERLLLGVEAHELLLEVTSTSGASVTSQESEGRALTLGGELWVLPGFALRGSAQKMLVDTAGDETGNSTLAAGAGLKSGGFSLDAAVRRNVQDEDADDPDEFTELRLMASYRF